MLEEVAFLRLAAAQPAPSAALFAIFAGAGPLDVAFARDGNDHLLALDQLIHAEFGDLAGDLAAPRFGELGFDLVKVLANDVEHERRVAQNRLKPLYFLDELREFGAHLVRFQT